MSLSTSLVNFLMRLPANRILDRVIGRLLRRQHSPIVVRSRFGYLLSVSGDDSPLSSVRTSVALGNYEGSYLHILSGLIDPGGVVLDIGANEGYVSLYLSNLVGPTGHVFAFEPHPVNVSRIEEIVRLNKQKNVTVIGQAVSDTVGTCTLHGDGAWGTLIEDVYRNRPSLLVPKITLDAFSEKESRLANVCLVKIDVEGHELQVLRGAKNLLVRTRPLVCFELNLTLLAYATYSVQEIFQFFSDNRFLLFVEENSGLVEFDWLKWRVANFVAIPEERLSEYRRRGIVSARRRAA